MTEGSLTNSSGQKASPGICGDPLLLRNQLCFPIYACAREIIKAYHELNGMPLDLPNVSRAIKDMYKDVNSSLPTPSLIISEVSRYFSIEEHILRGSLRNKGTAEARQIAMYLIRNLTQCSLPDIGKEFGRDHATVIHSIRKVEALAADPKGSMAGTLRDITANINNRLTARP